MFNRQLCELSAALAGDAAADFAQYMAKSVSAYQKVGVPVKYLSLRTEPLFETSDYPGTLMLAGQHAISRRIS
jgi:glucosylceramidase